MSGVGLITLGEHIRSHSTPAAEKNIEMSDTESTLTSTSLSDDEEEEVVLNAGNKSSSVSLWSNQKEHEYSALSSIEEGEREMER
jgi:hypothetical protein